MKIKAKVSRFTNKRRIVEIPSAVRDNFNVGEEVIIEKQNPVIKETKDNFTFSNGVKKEYKIKNVTKNSFEIEPMDSKEGK